MTTNLTYKQIQKIREDILQELLLMFPTPTVELMRLVDMRVQSVLMADLDDKKVEKDIKKKDNGKN